MGRAPSHGRSNAMLVYCVASMLDMEPEVVTLGAGFVVGWTKIRRTVGPSLCFQWQAKLKCISALRVLCRCSRQGFGACGPNVCQVGIEIQGETSSKRYSMMHGSARILRRSCHGVRMSRRPVSGTCRSRRQTSATMEFAMQGLRKAERGSTSRQSHKCFPAFVNRSSDASDAHIR